MGTAIPNVQELDDWIPGYDGSPVAEQANTVPPDIVSDVDDAEDSAATIEQLLIRSLATDIADIDSACTGVDAKLCGEIGVTLDDVDAKVSKVKGKITGKMYDDMQNAYGYINQMGFPIPSDTDVAYYQQTGDILGSMGIGTGDSEGTLPTLEETQGSNVSGTNVVTQETAGQIPVTTQTQGTQPAETNDTRGTPTGGSEGAGTYGPQPECMDILYTSGIVDNLPNYPATLQDVIAEMQSLQPLCFQPAWNATGEQLANGAGRVCLDGCYWQHPFGEERYEVIVPPGCSLLINPETGHVCAAPFGREPTGYVTMRLYNDQGCTPEGGPEPGEGTTDPPCDPTATVTVTTETGGQPSASSGGTGTDVSLQTGKRTVSKAIPPCPPEKCVVPDKDKCPPIHEEAEIAQWATDDDVCKAIENAINNIGENSADFINLIGLAGVKAGGGTLSDAIISAISGGNEPVIQGLLRRLLEWGNKKIKDVGNSANCDSPQMVTIWMREAMMAFIQKWLGILPRQAVKSTEHISNTVCQSELPTGSEADAAYLAGEIGEDEWKCWHKANGNHIEPRKKILHGKRARVTPDQIDKLYRRGEYDWEALKKRMREHGVIDDQDIQDIHKLNVAWPTQSDLVRFIAKDVENTENVEFSQLDKGFEENWSEKIEKWADGLGLDKELLKRYWRAHFHIPSYTMLRQMLFRLRPDGYAADLKVEKEDMRKALIQDDWAPGWVDRMMEIAYLPINRTDATHAFELHVQTEDELKGQYMDVGYNERDAKFMVSYRKRVREINEARRAGYPTLRSLANMYARCEIDSDMFSQVARRLVVSQDQLDNAIEAADMTRAIRQRQSAMKSIRRAFVLGIIDEGEANARLSNEGIDPQCVPGIMDNWKLDAMKRDKYLSATQLCKMRENGLVTMEGQLVALVRQGWSDEDALRITQQCGIDIQIRATRKMEQQAAKAMRAMEKARREAEKARRLAECGPTPCPKRSQQNTRPSEENP